MSTLSGPAQTHSRASAANQTDILHEPSTRTKYGYDSIYELLSATQGAGTTESYTYDAVGNRLSDLSGSGWSNNTSNELTSRPGVTYTFDYNGNTQTMVNSSGTATYNWDYENRLTSIALPGSGGTVYFKYDPFGRRIYKSSSSGASVFAYDGDNLVEETNAMGTAVARYSQGLNIDEPLAMLRSGATIYYQADGLGSLTSLSNTSGALTNTYTYNSFGNLTASTGSVTNAFRYTGREWDPETSLYYYRARYYDPQAGRFVGEDPVQFDSGINFYDYVRNNPLIGVDPWGLSTLVFDRGTGKLHLFDKDNGWVRTCSAANNTDKTSKGPWPDGVYSYGYHKDHPADPNGSFGSYGVYVFKVPGRPGIGVHAGQANKGGPKHPTMGCIRTDDDCMKSIQDFTATDPLTRIAVK